MKTNVTYIPTENLIAVLVAKGVPHVKQSGFYRVEGPKGRRLYVAATKKCGRIDISGFTVPFGAVPHFLGKFGRVEQMLDMSLPAEDIMTNFSALVDHMLTLPPEVKEAKPKAPKAKKEKNEGQAPSAPAESPDAKARRLELIRKVAAEKGMKVSPKTETELA